MSPDFLGMYPGDAPFHLGSAGRWVGGFRNGWARADLEIDQSTGIEYKGRALRVLGLLKLIIGRFLLNLKV